MGFVVLTASPCLAFASGETAFKAMMESFGWARRPMLERIHLIRKDVPITMIYGANTWIDTSTGKKVKMQRPDSYVRDMVRWVLPEGVGAEVGMLAVNWSSAHAD